MTTTEDYLDAIELEKLFLDLGISFNIPLEEFPYVKRWLEDSENKYDRGRLIFLVKNIKDPNFYIFMRKNQSIKNILNNKNSLFRLSSSTKDITYGYYQNNKVYFVRLPIDSYGRIKNCYSTCTESLIKLNKEINNL